MGKGSDVTMAKITITADFDTHIWESLSNDEKQEWVDEVVDAVKNTAYITNVKVED